MLINEAKRILEENGFRLEKPIRMKTQEDGISCGASALAAVYEYYGDKEDIETITKSVKTMKGRGTYDVCIGTAALKRGYDVTLYTCNPTIIDPTWKDITPEEMISKLKKMDKRGYNELIDNMIEFLENGGTIIPTEIDEELIIDHLENDIPLIAGLSCTYLYGSEKEYTDSKDNAVESDIRGDNTGHFVVIYGFEDGKCKIADPCDDNGFTDTNYYDVDAEHLIKSIYLGSCTNEGGLLAIESGSNRITLD